MGLKDFLLAQGLLSMLLDQSPVASYKYGHIFPELPASISGGIQKNKKHECC